MTNTVILIRPISLLAVVQCIIVNIIPEVPAVVIGIMVVLLTYIVKVKICLRAKVTLPT